MAERACRVIPLNIMTGRATLDVAARKLCMPSPARTPANRREAGNVVRHRLEFLLRDVSARFMAGHAECLLLMTRSAIKGLRLGVDAVSKAIVKAVNLLQP